MHRNNKKENRLILFLLVLLGSIGIGYAFLSQELTINGTSKVKASSWNIYFDNLVINPNNVLLSTGDVAAEIDDTTSTDITYTITLKKPGDFYEFTVDVVNDGTIDAMIGDITNKFGGVEIDSTHPLPDYLRYTISYSDGMPIKENHLLAANTSETYKVRLEFRNDITSNDLPNTDLPFVLNFGVQYVQTDSNAIAVSHPTTFSTDSWNTIIAAAKAGVIDAYHVGDTKTVELENLGTYTLRIANTSNPPECSMVGFSETACGFVLEFVDIIKTYRMNPYDSTGLSGDGNVGGWPSSEMRTYVNGTIYNALPSELKSEIANTTVVSGHGSTGEENNFTSTDKLYLLSSHEVWEDADGNTGDGIDARDTAYHNTRQLDYYAGLNVTTSNYSETIKQYNSSNTSWWLRSPRSNYLSNFFIATDSGDWNYSNANNTNGVSPAFRIA